MDLEPGEIDEHEPDILDNWFTNMKNIPELPKLLHIDLDKVPNGTFDECKKITFTFKNDKINDYFTIYFYVPFIQNKSLQQNSQKSNVEETIQKISKYNSRNKDFHVSVGIKQCEKNICLDGAYNVNVISNYLKNIDNVCSSCYTYNRGWDCCGRFAPYMYMYFYLLIENNFDNYKLKHGFTELKQYQMYKFATVFYKVITGYASYDEKYSDLISYLDVNYNVRIPTHNDNPDFWYLPENNYNDSTFENNKSYMVNLCRNYETAHHFFIFRCNDYIIICDSWRNSSISREPITRIFKIDVFLYCINYINHVYSNMMNFKSSERRGYNKKYNICMDSLFLIPYVNKQITGNKFSFPQYELYEIRVIDRKKINFVFDKISRDNNAIFNRYLYLGGKKRKTIKNKKQYKNNKSYKNKTQNKKKNKTQNKNNKSYKNKKIY
jgi:hypothetical protein